MASNDSRSDLTWNEALKDENCVEVRKLLWKDSCSNALELLKEGWSKVDAQPSLKSKSASVWKGRTALHVAARRGDVKLVEDILAIAYPEPHCGTSMENTEQVGIGSTDEVGYLLEVIDKDYELDALGMAVVNGNKQIANLLQNASLHCGRNPYNIGSDAIKDEAGFDEVKKEQLSSVIKEVLSKYTPENADNIRYIKELYMDDCDFNFIHKYKEGCDRVYNQDNVELDMHLFFHFTFSTWTMPNAKKVLKRKLLQDIRTQIITRARDKELLEYLLVTLMDGQGRTPLHVAVDSQKVKEFLKATNQVLGKGDNTKECLNVRDSANRTPLYRAAANKLFDAVRDLLEDKRTDVHAKIEHDAYGWGKGLDIDKLSWKNNFKSDCVYVQDEKLTRKGFNNKSNSLAGPGPFITRVTKGSSTALHVAIIHKHEDIVEMILEEIFNRLRALLDSTGHFEQPLVRFGPGCKDDHFANSSGHFESCDHDCKIDHLELDCSTRYTCFRDCQDDHAADSKCTRRYTWPILTATLGDKATYQQFEVTTLQLTVLVGSIPILQQLLKAEEESKKPRYFSGRETNFILAAAMGNPGMIKAFLDSERGKFNYEIRDSFRNTALHHALKGKHVQFYPHMIDFVGCHHVYSSRWNNDVWLSRWLANPDEEPQDMRDVEKDTKEDLDVGRYGQRRGSINLLLEAGIDIWAKNVHKRTASPDPDAPKDFVEWWYEKVATETKEEQTKLYDAANAISVTAALVATASYVGPLQPPLGYNEGSLQVNILAVRIFVACDSLSFYFALAAIMWALLPSLPLQKESMVRELKQTRIFVAFAVTCLFPSIICVLVAFAAGYIAVVPDHGLSNHGIIVATTVGGGFVCLFVMTSFLGRLSKVLKDRLKRTCLGQIVKLVAEDFNLLKSLKSRLEGPLHPLLEAQNCFSRRLGRTRAARWLIKIKDKLQDDED